MPDISKCTGEDCKLKHKCYRFTSESSNYQSWFAAPPNKEEYHCEYFYPIYKNDKTNNETKS